MDSYTRFIFCLAALAVLASCEKQHLEVYEEPITSLVLVAQPDSGQPVVLSFLDNDGIGGLAAVTNDGVLAAHTIYDCRLIINNRSNAMFRLSHFVDSTSVVAKPEKHQVFYQSKDQLQLATVYADQDENGFPIGFKTTIETGAESEGKLAITILHYPNKMAAGVSEGNLTRAGGTTDLQVEFDIQIVAGQ